MPNGYQRQSVASIVDGLIIHAADLNNEFQALLGAFDISTGHTHDGSTVGTGAPISKVNGVAFPATPSTNTVPVVTSSNTITYEAVPNAALANSTITVGSTSFALGSTHATVAGLTLTSPTITGTMVATGATVTAGTFNSPTLSSPTITNASMTGATSTTTTLSGTTTLAGSLVATGFTIVGGTLSGTVLASGVTGTTQAPGNNTTRIATTEFVTTAISTGAFLASANNLSDLASAASARSNLGLGSAALKATSYFQTDLGYTPITQDGTSITIGIGFNSGSIQWSLGGTVQSILWDQNNLTSVSQLTNDAGYATLVSPALTGNPTAPTQATANSSTRLATTAYVQANLASYATLASPALTGNPTAPTQTTGNNSTRVATTAFVQSAFPSTFGAINTYIFGEFNSASGGTYTAGSSYAGATLHTNCNDADTAAGFATGQTWLCMGHIVISGTFLGVLFLRTA